MRPAQADDDVETAAVLVDHGRHPVACFMSQQAAEKATTGLLEELR